MTSAQAYAVGVTRAEWRTFLRRGDVTAMLPTVFVVGDPQLTRSSLLAAARLRFPSFAVGGRTLLEEHKCLAPTHRVEGWIPGRLPDEEQLTRVPMVDGRPGLIVPRSWRGVAPPRVELANGLPGTTVPRAFVDLAAHHPPRVVRRAWIEAEFRALLDPDAIRRELDHGRPGTSVVAGLLEDRFPATRAGDDLRSRRELRLLRAVLALGLPRPRTNRLIVLDCGTESSPDLWFVDERVIVEIDPEQHDLDPRDRADKVRSARLQAAGFAVLQFAGHTIDTQLDWCAATIEQTVRARQA